MIRKSLSIAISLCMMGCSTHQPSISKPVGTLLGEQLTRQDTELVGQRFRTLLDFEHDADAVFVDGNATCANGIAHTGMRSLHVAGNAAEIHVDSLLYGSTLPADWTLIGAYIRVPGGGPVRTTLLADGKAIASAQRQSASDAWVFAAVDLTRSGIAAPLKQARQVRLQIQCASGEFFIDDVLLVNNRKKLIDAGVPEFASWTIERVGFAINIHSAGGLDVSIPSNAQSTDGWGLDEANAIRARLSGTGASKTWTLFPDGRSLRDGVMTLAPGADRGLLESHSHPADVVVDDATGRLDRDSPGDANNDGYNEVRGAYEIIARGGRVNLKIVPHEGVPIVSPVIEIKRLTGGVPTAWVEGRVFQSACSAGADSTLVVLPIRIDQPTEVTLRTSSNSPVSTQSGQK